MSLLSAEVCGPIHKTYNRKYFYSRRLEPIPTNKKANILKTKQKPQKPQAHTTPFYFAGPNSGLLCVDDITWHAGPFNLEIENMDAQLFDYGLDLAHQLDRQFGKPLKNALVCEHIKSSTHANVHGTSHDCVKVTSSARLA